MKLIVGLGNPGEQYLKTRHNLGFELLDDLIRKWNLGNWSKEEKFKSEVVKGERQFKFGLHKLILVKPLTFMNSSGEAVGEISRFYKIDPSDIIIIHDELDLLLGHLKVRLGGAAAGHHGVESIIDHLSTDKFIRIRLGMGPLDEESQKLFNFNKEQFVLTHFLPKESSKVKSMLKRGIEAIETLLEQGLEKTQNQFN